MAKLFKFLGFFCFFLSERQNRSWESADKPGSVVDSHSSGTHVTVSLKRPTRERARAARCRPEGRRAPLFGLAPSGVYRAATCYHSRGALLPHLFTLAGVGPRTDLRLGGMFSVALSVGSRPPGVTWHPALRSPDFPPWPFRAMATAWPTPARIIPDPHRQTRHDRASRLWHRPRPACSQ